MLQKPPDPMSRMSPTEHTESPSIDDVDRKRIALAIVVVFLLVVGCVPIMNLIFPTGANEAGDTYGVLNALFTGCGVVGAVAALHLQRIQIRKLAEEQKEARAGQLAAEKLLLQMAETMHVASVNEVLMHCNQRYSSIWAQRNNAAYADGFWDRYFNLQLDQFEHYVQGMIPERVWHYWMKCRYNAYRDSGKLAGESYADAWNHVRKDWTYTEFVDYFELVHQLGGDPDQLRLQSLPMLKRVMSPAVARLRLGCEAPQAGALEP